MFSSQETSSSGPPVNGCMQNEINRPLPGAGRNQEMFTFTLSSFSIRGFPGGSVVKNPPAKQEMQETWVQSLGRKDPWKEGMATRFYSCLGKSYGQMSLADYTPWGCRVRHDRACMHEWIFQYKRSLNSNPGKMALWENSPPSPLSADFPKKVAISCPQNSPLNL